MKSVNEFVLIMENFGIPPISEEEEHENDYDPDSEQIDSKSPSITKQIESETRFDSDDDKIEHKEGIDNIKKEQNIKPEFDPDIKPLNQTNKGIAIPSECPECGITLSSISKLTTHLIDVHKTEKLFPCDHCDKKFSRKHFKEPSDFSHIPFLRFDPAGNSTFKKECCIMIFEAF